MSYAHRRITQNRRAAGLGFRWTGQIGHQFFDQSMHVRLVLDRTVIALNKMNVDTRGRAYMPTGRLIAHGPFEKIMRANKYESPWIGLRSIRLIGGYRFDDLNAARHGAVRDSKDKSAGPPTDRLSLPDNELDHLRGGVADPALLQKSAILIQAVDDAHDSISG